jgi:protein-L-isoaspartate O-methyltransferase
MTAQQPPHAALAEAILDAAYWGDRTLADPAWRKAWDACPRASFAPDRYFLWDGDAWQPHDRAQDPDAWDALVHNPLLPVITQVDGRDPTSSLSAPALVAAMLGALGVTDGMRVLESGTGSGWTSCLLAARLGDENVVSVEVDGGLAPQARINAKRVGRWPAILVGDGLAGYPPGAPYDRVSATHAVTRIPAAWIGQTVPGGIVAAPLYIAAGVDVLVALTVAGDGSAAGPILLPVAFMGSRTGPDSTGRVRTLADGPGRDRSGVLDVPAVAEAQEMWVLRLAVPGLEVTGPLLVDGDDTVWLTAPDGSWAVAYVPQGASWDSSTVEEHGPRDVWAIAEDAYNGWTTAGQPTLDRYGVTVEANGTHLIWLDDPGRVVTLM